MIKIQKIMPTEKREILAILDDEGKFEMQFYYNQSEAITITNDENGDDPYAVYLQISKEDWVEIKKFIDNIFNL